jgi:hypothetical protein
MNARIRVRHVANQHEQAASPSDLQISPDFPKKEVRSIETYGEKQLL